MAEEEKSVKERRPQARKRDIRNEKRRLINKSFKSNVRTTINHFLAALASGDKAQVGERLSALYSAMDRGVKRGVFKHNKAARIKARAMQKVQTRLSA